MVQINSAQDYDLIVTLKFAEPEGDCHVYLHRGSFATASGTVYYRYGDSAKWEELTDLGLSEDKLSNLMNKAKKGSGE